MHVVSAVWKRFETKKDLARGGRGPSSLRRSPWRRRKVWRELFDIDADQVFPAHLRQSEFSNSRNRDVLTRFSASSA